MQEGEVFTFLLVISGHAYQIMPLPIPLQSRNRIGEDVCFQRVIFLVPESLQKLLDLLRASCPLRVLTVSVVLAILSAPGLCVMRQGDRMCVTGVAALV